MNTIIEAFFLCLMASIIWAPIVFLMATRFTNKDSSGIADKLWPTALTFAVLPALFAPIAAAAGLSLRQSAPLPPMVAHEAPADFIPTAEFEPIVATAEPLNIAAILETSATLYFYGFLMFLALGIVRMVWFSYRVGYAFEIDNPELEAGLERWRQRMGIKHSPRYAFSDAISSVCVHGFFRPVVLMPMTILDRVPMKDVILMGAHEMAHIKRGDTILFALCNAAKAVFWFNPFMQRIAARANLAAEKAADALVITHGAERRQYASCFVQGLRFAAGSSSLGRELVPSFTPFDKRSRRDRLDAILSNTSSGSSLKFSHKLGMFTCVMIAGGLAFAQAAFAVAPPPPREALPTAPVEGKVSSSFGTKRIILGKETPAHKGVDIKAKRGTLVRASGNGKVIDATSRYRDQPAWGKVIVIDHGHGLVTRYAHLDSYIVKKGDTVKAGDTIGSVGSTGKTTGPHLHFEVIQDGLAIDPAPVLTVAPMPAPAVAPSPAAAPKIVREFARIIPSAPTANMVAVSPAAPVPPVAPMSLSQQIEQKLSSRFVHIDEEIEEAMDNIESSLEGMEFEFEEFANTDFNAIKEFNALKVFASNNDSENWEWLNKDARANIIKAQQKAAEIARNSVAEAKADFAHAREKSSRIRRDKERHQHELDRAKHDRQHAKHNKARQKHKRQRAERDQERAQAQRERDQERLERDQERIERDAERAQERAQREIERTQEHAERDRERAENRANRDRERAEAKAERALEGEHTTQSWSYSYSTDPTMDKQEMLKAQEEALKEAQASLERELSSIKRQRAALKKKK